MALYVILCMYSFGVFYSFGITPNIIESILEFILVVIELALFVILFATVWPSHESKKIEKEAKNLHTLQAHQVDSVTTIAVIVVAQVMVEIKLIFQKND